MFTFNIAPNFQYQNPPIQIIGQAPNQPDGQPGRVGFIIQLPNVPNSPIFQVMFDRNQAEDFLEKMREANDVSKGIKKL